MDYFLKRMDREQIEKELASKFSKQLLLESNRISQVYFREEEKVEEDDFPSKIFFIFIYLNEIFLKTFFVWFSTQR